MNNALRNVSNVFPSIKLLQDDETSFIMYLFLIINEDWSFIWSNVDHHHSSVAQKKKKEITYKGRKDRITNVDYVGLTEELFVSAIS